MHKAKAATRFGGDAFSHAQVWVTLSWHSRGSSAGTLGLQDRLRKLIFPVGRFLSQPSAYLTVDLFSTRAQNYSGLPEPEFKMRPWI